MEQGGGINPYAAPGADALVAEMPVTGSGAKLAGRGARLGAAIIDSLVAMSVLTPLQFVMGVYDGFPKIKPLTIPQTLGWSAFGLVFWLAVHSDFLVDGSQTLGKRHL